jgi:hypothetical protein
LDEKRFVISEIAQRTDNGVERFPASRRAPGAAVNNQLVRVLGNIRIELFINIRRAAS